MDKPLDLDAEYWRDKYWELRDKLHQKNSVTKNHSANKFCAECGKNLDGYSYLDVLAHFYEKHKFRLVRHHETQ